MFLLDIQLRAKYHVSYVKYVLKTTRMRLHVVKKHNNQFQ